MPHNGGVPTFNCSRASQNSLIGDTIGKLRGVSGPDGRGWYTALCPFHKDEHRPNLRLRQTGFRCMACGEKGSIKKLAAQLGIDTATDDPVGLSLSALAEAKGLPGEFLRSLGVADGYVGSGARRSACVVIPYMDAAGEIVAIRKRLTLSGPTRFLWRRGDHPRPYGLWRLEEARTAGWLMLVEGESDCWTLWYHGIPALGLPGASTWRPEYAALLKGLTVYVWHEPGAGGHTFTKGIFADVPDLRVVKAPPGAKDPSALYLRDRGIFRETLTALLGSSCPMSQLLDEAREAATREAYEKGRTALEDPALLHRLVLETEAMGHVDDRENVAVLHLVIISRLSERPISVVVKGPSAEGKSHLVHKVLEVHPLTAAYTLSAMSEHALAYSEEPLAHRFLVLEEAAALDKRFTTYLVRSLLSEGRLRYETVEKTKDGLKPRLIEREGPIGLISTTTAHSLDAETETRMLTLETQESSNHLKMVLLAIAERRNRLVTRKIPEDISAALRWLELSGKRRVVMPYAHWLADRLPVQAMAARLTRDFDGLLAIIEASSILHQRQRSRDDEGRIVASVADYAVAVSTIGRAFELAANDSITERQRDVYELVKLKKEAVSVSAVARELGIHPSNASRHLRALAAKGFLINSNAGEKGKPATYEVATPLPEKQHVLPPWQDLAAAFPDLAADYVDPISGEVCVCNTRPFSPQHRNTPGLSVADAGMDVAHQQTAIPTATPTSSVGAALGATNVAVSRSEKQGSTHTPQSDRRRISL